MKKLFLILLAGLPAGCGKDPNPKNIILFIGDSMPPPPHLTAGKVVKGTLEMERCPVAGFATKGHSASMGSIFAFGSSSEKFSGIIDNTDIAKRMMEFIQVPKRFGLRCGCRPEREARPKSHQ